jgi:hypothetical protein
MRPLIFLILFVPMGMRAQTFNLSDSLRDVFKQRITPSFGIDTRNSFITGSTAKIYSIKAGMAFGTRLTVGLGYNFIGTELQEEFIHDGQWTRANIHMNYFAPYVQYSFYRRGPWEFSTPIQFGIGKSFLREKTEAGIEVFNKDRVVLYEPGMAFEFKILNLIGVGAGFGYRIMLKNNKGIQQQFTSPVYALRCRLIFDEVYSRYKKYRQADVAAPTE